MKLRKTFSRYCCGVIVPGRNWSEKTFCSTNEIPEGSRNLSNYNMLVFRDTIEKT